VAVPKNIGERIAFQGATAKNRALVAAFEQYVRKPIQVSKYCHLTGALGVALMLADQKITATRFKGIALYANEIPIRSEVCELCTNHCKITVAEVDGTPVAYGFLCGRDYETRKRIDNNRSGFDLVKARQKTFRTKPEAHYRQALKIGIPAALHLYEDLPLWQSFFGMLDIETVTSEAYADAVKTGKRLAKAEFCAPMAALHGHVNFLLDKADYIFLPIYLERRTFPKKNRRQYCYYTQYAPALASMIGGPETTKRCLMPLMYYLYNPVYSKVQLYRMLRPLVQHRIGFKEIAAAYDHARAHKEHALLQWQNLYTEHLKKDDGLHVVLMGRPYTILSPAMNKGIPNILASLGVKTFFQDMIVSDGMRTEQAEPFLKEVHWHYAAQILQTVELVARRAKAYPVLITSFKCTPDAFVIDYFKKIMEHYGKPYLILQLDEHDSRVGYETRIEAALRAFHNHQTLQSIPKVAPRPARTRPKTGSALFDKTLLLPNWDSISLRLVIANLRRVGIDARLLEETQTSIQKSLRHNTGQCIPLNIIAQEFIDYIEKHDLDPSRSLLWMMSSKIACNLGLFPYHIKQILNARGRGMERADIYYGRISYSEVSTLMAVDTYFAYMFGGFVKRMACKLRPYEKAAGATDRVVAESLAILEDAFFESRSREKAVAAVVSRFEGIDVDRSLLGRRPKVAIFGDLYARDNDVFNQNLIRFIEANGGEVVTTPYSSYVQMIANSYLRKWLREGNIRESIASKALISMLKRLEKKYYAHFARILGEAEPTYNVAAHKILAPYNLIVENTGESMDNIVKLFYLRKHHPDLALLVQVIPAFCCPSIVTEAMSFEIERKTGLPIVSITYDGTGGNKNDVIIPYLKYPRNDAGMHGHDEAFHQNWMGAGGIDFRSKIRF
jgi:predicted nucleotide-binding protein (sugar kinase/HSP70/actin superfamily)